MVSAAVVGSLTWNDLDKLSPVANVLVHISWYCSLVLSIGAVAVGAQQSIFLTRVGLLPEAQARAIFRQVLSRETSQGIRKTRWEQAFIWQAAMGLLEWGLYTWIFGFVVFVGNITKINLELTGAKDQAVSLVLQCDVVVEHC